MLRRWTFERPAYGVPGRNIADHCFVRSDGLWHLFYTSVATEEGEVDYIGHAVSSDLRHWSERPAVLAPDAGAPPWRSKAVWAPMVAALPAGGWVLAYAGVDTLFVQRIGFLRSDDLETWSEIPGFSPFEPDPTRYNWRPTGYGPCRDPHLFLEDGLWHLLYATRGVDGLASIGHSTSPDLAIWTHFDPLLGVGDPWAQPDLESPGIVRVEGRYVLHYAWLGVWAIRADSLSGPWQSGIVTELDVQGSAGELVFDGKGWFLSRRRVDRCHSPCTLVWTDSLDTSSWPFRLLPWPRLSGFGIEWGEAFAGQSSFGDGQAWRGGAPVKTGEV